MRHAKSSWGDAAQADHQRQLARRGRAAARRMARFLAQKQRIPHIILSSTAERAKQTVDQLLEGFAFAGDVFFRSELYQSSPEQILALLCELDSRAAVALLVGHNPELEDVLFHLTGQEETMKTACVAEVQFEIEHWAQLAENPPGRLAALWQPKELP